jgi:hypothetical protein
VADLSPAAQAVNTAVLGLYPYGVARDMALSSDLAIAAAALRAAADQVVPVDGWIGRHPEAVDTCQDIRAELLTLATELEAN